MRRFETYKQIVGFLGVLLLCNAAHVSAYFQDFINGVRPSGMGDAFVSVADDTNAVLFNPAGLAQLKTIMFSGMYSDLYTNLNAGLFTDQNDRLGYNLAAMAMPIKVIGGSVELGWSQFASTFYQENIIALAYGKPIWSPYYFDLGLKVDLGFTAKLLHWSVAENETTLDPDLYPYSERQKIGYTADAGLMIIPLEHLKIGLSIENIIPANMGLTETEIIPMVNRIGASYQWNWSKGHLSSLLVAFEMSERKGIYTPKLGVESGWWNRAVALRVGVNPEQVTSGLSYHYNWSSENIGLQVDYAFAYPFYVLDTLGSHRVGVTMDWGFKEKMAEEIRKAIDVASIAAAVAKSVAVASEMSRAVERTVTQAERIALLGDTENLKILVHDAGKKADTAILAAEAALSVVDETMPELKTKAMDALVLANKSQAEAKRVAQLYQQAIQPKQVYQNNQRTAGNQEELPRLPEVYTDRIIIGIEARILTDFGDLREIQKRIAVLQDYLDQKVDFRLEYVFYTLQELELAFQQGKIDVAILYGSGYKKYYLQGMQPVLTAQINFKDTQQCCLIVRDDSQITKPEQLKNRRIGYSNSKLAATIGTYFYPDQRNFSPTQYFLSVNQFKNVYDSLVALQMDGVDGIVEFEYASNIYKRLGMPKGIKLIATSGPVPNSPVLIKPSKNKAKSEHLQFLLDTLLECHRRPELKELLNFFYIDRFVPFDENKYKDYLSQ